MTIRRRTFFRTYRGDRATSHVPEREDRRFGKRDRHGDPVRLDELPPVVMPSRRGNPWSGRP